MLTPTDGERASILADQIRDVADGGLVRVWLLQAGRYELVDALEALTLCLMDMATLEDPKKRRMGRPPKAAWEHKIRIPKVHKIGLDTE